eukprot:CAMPEP_0171079974 /NCGR_PEP_ID=MMETSP0766_2-20121228/15585_1 /TAXON_ID=439317 /ORGANISM="Gambierdiscus australes, Strain CAWD 149" /LENGTH=79 /DNA_ID=CAMNT_0011537185 /DNA_START=106 /DNA_END=342 /DNA_ORIENTATION=+
MYSTLPQRGMEKKRHQSHKAVRRTRVQPRPPPCARDNHGQAQERTRRGSVCLPYAQEDVLGQAAKKSAVPEWNRQSNRD